MASCASVHRYLNSCRYFSALSFLVFSTLKPALLSALSLLGNCETYDSKIAVVRNRQIVSRVLGSRRCLDAVFWRLMHRCERQCSESVPCVDCLFCTTGTFENRVSQLPNCFVISDDRRKKLHSGYIFQKKQSFFLFHESACSASEQQGSFGNNSTAPIKKKLKPIIPVGSGPSKLLLVDKETHAPASPIISQTP